jgi:hypothetical protein
MNQIFRFFPALRVHSWGGFGSQLFTAYVVLKLQKTFPNRRIKVVIHTSGVTRRFSEFDFETLGVRMTQVEDFKGTEAQNNIHKIHLQYSSNLPKVLKRLLLEVLSWTRLVQSADTDLSFNLISLWTLSLRGHYTRLSLDESLVKSLYQAVFPRESQYITRSGELVVHYRLGDLLNLDEKQPISIERVDGILETISLHSSQPVLLSDSKEAELVKFLEHSTILKFSSPLNFNPNKTLRICIDADNFVGTGAKISLWAAIFRYYVFQKESFLPKELDWSVKLGLKSNWY